nr:hypothetical protein [Tanacetum cinerariifolium]
MCEMFGQFIQRKHEEEQAANAQYWKIPVCCDDDDDYNFAITPNEPVDSLSIVDKHLNTIPATESNEFIKSSVENLVPNPSDSEGENECDVPACFTTFSNILFDADYEFDSSDDQSLYDEDVPEKIFSNPLFEEEIIPMKIDQHHDNVESDLIESLLNHDSSIISSSSKINSLLDEFAGELTLLKSILPGIDETDCDPQNEIRLIEGLFDSLMEEIDLSFNPDDPMPPGIEEDDYESKRDILIRKELLENYSLSLPIIVSYHFDIPSFSRPPAKPLDGVLNVKVMGDIFEHKVPMPRLMLTQPTLVPNQEKYLDLLSHLGHEAFQPSAECQMIIHGKNKTRFSFVVVLWFCMFTILGNVKTHAEGFYPPVFISSASLGNHSGDAVASVGGGVGEIEVADTSDVDSGNGGSESRSHGDSSYQHTYDMQQEKDNKEKDKIRAKTGQNQEQTGSVEKSKVKPDKVKA